MENKENHELRLIRKSYGDEMKKFCIHNFSNILNASLEMSEKSNEEVYLLYNTLRNSFEPGSDLIKDILKDEKTTLEFIEFIKLGHEEFYYHNYVSCNGKRPEELFSEKGYTLFKCETNEDISKYLKYYSVSDMICTSKDSNRINDNYIFFAIKDNADYVNRSNKPVKEDEYDLSVLCIQVSKHDNSIKIISRYNDSVLGSIPDCTFNNNLDNINEGLTDSFKKYYNIDITKNYNYKDTLSIDGYIRVDNKFYKPYLDMFGYGYCTNNLIVNKLDGGSIINDYKDKEKYIFMGYYILDLVNKKVILFDEDNIKDSFPDTINSYDINKIVIKKNKEEKTKDIIIKSGEEDIIITIDDKNNIISYTNPKVERISSHFMKHNNTLKELKLPNLKESSRDFLSVNRTLEKVEIPNLEIWGDETFTYHPVLSSQYYIDDEEDIKGKYK